MTFRERWARFRGTIRREALEREMNREMQFHLDMAAQRNAERGMRPETAKREAQLAFGSTEQFKESGREAYRARTAENVAADIRFALRSMLFPVGEAWRGAWRRDPEMPLYGPDGFHPTPTATYLAALVIYQQITGRSPVGLPPWTQMPADRALLLQEAAQEANAQFGRR